jgi:hypothetical protein
MNKIELKVKSGKTGVTWVWWGGHEIHGFYRGKEVALFNFGDFAKQISPKEALRELLKVANASPRYQAGFAADLDWYDKVKKQSKKKKRVRV